MDRSTVSRARAMAESLPLLALLVSAMACAAAAQPPTPSEETPAGVGIKISFRPSVAIVVGIFAMIFSLTFLLLMYAKFCHPSSTPLLPTSQQPAPVAANQQQQPAGVPKPVIESLPFFRFAALRGARQGLECAVCLARFDDADLLRLLPRCRHAFHLDCVDRWLDTSTSCPLCRTRVDADDADELGLKYAASPRFVFGGDDSDVDRLASSASGRDILAGIFVERVPSSRFGDEAPQAQAQPQWLELDRHKHRIVVSDVVFKSRWSDLNSADLMALDTREMLGSMSSRRFEFDDPPPYPELFREEEEAGSPVMSVAVKVKMEKKRLLETSLGEGACSSSSDAVEPVGSAIISSGVRSMSEIVRLPRVRAAAVRERLSLTEEEERARRRWVLIARRTARWFAGRERRYIKGEEASTSASASASASAVEDDHASSSRV